MAFHKCKATQQVFVKPCSHCCHAIYVISFKTFSVVINGLLIVVLCILTDNRLKPNSRFTRCSHSKLIFILSLQLKFLRIKCIFQFVIL